LAPAEIFPAGESSGRAGELEKVKAVETELEAAAPQALLVEMAWWMVLRQPRYLAVKKWGTTIRANVGTGGGRKGNLTRNPMLVGLGFKRSTSMNTIKD
jgi:hypothetical protein